MVKIKFYHGSASRKKLEKIESICKNFETGIGLLPKKLFNTDYPYFLDNGAYSGNFEETSWRETLDLIDRKHPEPDFVVLPDKFNRPIKTFCRSQKYRWDVKEYDFDYYYVVQKPYRFDRSNKTAIDRAIELGAEGVFIGGSWQWKRQNAKEIVELAHKNNLNAHIGMPKNYLWAYNTGADSMDTSNIARNRNYQALKLLEKNISD